MSTSLDGSTVVELFRRETGMATSPQFDSWPAWLRWLLRRAAEARQRDALRAIADNKHLLDDIGLSSGEALGEADRRFWQ